MKDAVITTIDLLRHGECEDGECADGHCYRGSIDVKLNSKGWQQMEHSVEYVRHYYSSSMTPWQAVVSSPLIRCALFSEMLARQYHLPIITDPRFKEMHFGEWEGQSIKMIWQTQAQEVQAWSDNPVLSPPPGGEPADTFATRVKTGLGNILSQFAGQHILLVAHGGVIRVLLAHCLSIPLTALHQFDVPYACLSRIQVVCNEEPFFYRLIAHNIIPPVDENA